MTSEEIEDSLAALEFWEQECHPSKTPSAAVSKETSPRRATDFIRKNVQDVKRMAKTKGGPFEGIKNLPKVMESKLAVDEPEPQPPTPELLGVVDLADIQMALTGYARIKEYNLITPKVAEPQGDDLRKALSQENNLQIAAVFEGHFHKGQMHGFGRSIDSNGKCQVGFWSKQPDQGMSLPYGKWASYFKGGKPESAEGIYLGNAKLWNRQVKKVKIVDYLENTKPKLTFGQSLGEMFGGCAMCSGPAPTTSDPRSSSLSPQRPQQ
mmetsp:Transcript_4598/g.7002  ORF Transcript_4598/g.7002 Transcript_4598/m.7002 type:complete len:266 (+) Transcript_4598:3185-3982(+)